MSASLSLYVPRASGLHRLNPLTKLVIALGLLVAGVALPGQWTSYAVVALIVAPLAVWGDVLAPLAKSTWKIVWPFALSVVVIQGLFWRAGPVWLAPGPLAVYSEGLLYAFGTSGRILLLVSSFLLLSLTTRPDLLMGALSRAGLSASVAYIVTATIQLVPRFQARAATIADAQRARGLETEGTFIRRARALLPLILPLALSSIVEVEERAMAIESRAFGAKRPKTSLVSIPDTAIQKWVRWAILVLCVALLAVRFAWRS